MGKLSSLVAGCPYVSTLFFLLGGFTFLKFAIKTLFVFAETFVLPGTDLKKFGARKGAWAVVTGASDGIGREYAIQLAKKGLNVLVVARNKEALTAVTDEIDAACGQQVQTKRVILDVSKNDAEAWGRFEQTIDGLDIGILVNNVGKSHAYPVYFVNSLPEEMNDILSVNVNATVRITKMIIPGMVKRQRGLVLNIGSFSGIIPSPMLATYSASKAFLDTFSAALADEVKTHGVVVQCLNPYFVVSKMSKIRKPTPTVPTAAAFVKASLSKVGLACGARFIGRPSCSTPYWSHSLIDYFLGCLGMKQLTVYYTHRLHLDIRKRVDRKLANANKSQ